MEYQQYQPYQPPQQEKKTAGLGNGIASLVLGICSFFPYCGWIMGIVGIVLAGKSKRAAIEGNTSYGLAKVGKTLSVIGIIFSAILTLIFIIAAIGSATVSRSYYW